MIEIRAELLLETIAAIRAAEAALDKINADPATPDAIADSVFDASVNLRACRKAYLEAALRHAAADLSKAA